MKTRILRNKDDIRRCSDSILGLEQYLPIKVTIDKYKPTRSEESSRKMYAMLDDVSKQVVWYGEKYNRYQWKDIFTSAYRKEQKMAKGIDGGLVVFGEHTKNMNNQEISDIIELIYAFGAEHDVVFKEE